MWTTKTFKKTIKTSGGKETKETSTDTADAVLKSADSIFNEVFESFNLDYLADVFKGAAKTVVSEEKVEVGSASCYCLNDGSVQITTNNGHIVIEGNIKSLKVNGEDIEFEDE